MTNKNQSQDLRLTKSQYERLQKIAAEEGLSVAEAVHKAIKEAHPLIKLIADSGLQPLKEKPTTSLSKTSKRSTPR